MTEKSVFSPTVKYRRITLETSRNSILPIFKNVFVCSDSRSVGGKGAEQQ